MSALPTVVVRPIERVVVVVPVRDEQDLLGRCLTALEVAVTRLVSERPGIRCGVTVVLDRCTDGSADVVAGFPSVRVVVSDAGSAGAARACGLRGLDDDVAAASTWVANTDADSVVPAHWLTGQVELAEAGTDLVVGTVAPDPGDVDTGVLDRWWAAHRLGDEHEHVHGANLGFRLDAYRAVGGYAPLAEHEDLDLVVRLRARGGAVATDDVRVLTSGRQHGRTPGGFARYLRELAASTRPLSTAPPVVGGP